MQKVEYSQPISLAVAKRVIEAAEREASAHDWAMVMAVVDSTGHLVALHKMDHAQFGSIAIAQAKARTAVYFKRPTKVFEDAVTADSSGAFLLSVPDICPVEGGIPLVSQGAIIGAIGVSGERPAQDGQVAIAGARICDD